jgi:hypothetical protein
LKADFLEEKRKWSVIQRDWLAYLNFEFSSLEAFFIISEEAIFGCLTNDSHNLSSLLKY